MLNVLSLFDGGSTGKVALEDIGLKINEDFNYYASEIDKNAIKSFCANTQAKEIYATVAFFSFEILLTKSTTT